MFNKKVKIFRKKNIDKIFRNQWKMAASAVYILDLKGKVLISRNYRGDLPLNTIDRFPKLLMEAEEEGTMTPVMTDDGVTFIHIKCNNIYVVSIAQGTWI
mgnify:CR=1 FL=1